MARQQKLLDNTYLAAYLASKHNYSNKVVTELKTKHGDSFKIIKDVFDGVLTKEQRGLKGDNLKKQLKKHPTVFTIMALYEMDSYQYCLLSKMASALDTPLKPSTMP